jgi:hypothetical protein
MRGPFSSDYLDISGRYLRTLDVLALGITGLRWLEWLERADKQ